MEIRELKAKDVRTIARILGKLKSSSVNDLVVMMESDKTDPMRVGLSIFHLVAAEAADDIYEWLAGLVGMTVEEFNEQPFDAPIEIVRALAARRGIADFFAQATRRAGNDSSPGSTTSSNPDTDGQTAP